MCFYRSLMASQKNIVERTPLQKFFDVLLEVLKLVRVFLSTVQNVLSYSPTTHTQPGPLFERLQKIEKERFKKFEGTQKYGNNYTYYLVPITCGSKVFWEKHGETLLEFLKHVQECFLGKDFEQDDYLRVEANNIVSRCFPGFENDVSWILKNLNTNSYDDVSISLSVFLSLTLHTQNYRLLGRSVHLWELVSLVCAISCATTTGLGATIRTENGSRCLRMLGRMYVRVVTRHVILRWMLFFRPFSSLSMS